MARAIEFRYWDEEEKEMIYYRNPYTLCGKTVLVLDDMESRSYVDSDDVEIIEDLMQFTGLPDKNNKKIFDGDIVKFLTFEYGNENIIETTGVIVWSDARFAWYVTGKYNNLLSHIIKTEIEVIGNIHENPELLEDK